MTCGILIQARSGSSRFPKKIYEDINGKSTLRRVLEGVDKSVLAHKIILAMPTYDMGEFSKRSRAGEFDGVCMGRFYTYFGSPDDLVDRYFMAAREHNIDLIVRVTADCPLIPGNLIDEMLTEYLQKGYNGFMGNNCSVSGLPYPSGTDVEIFPYWMLGETWRMTKDPYHREHVTPYMYRTDTKYTIHQFLNCRPNTMISMRFPDFSFDTPNDLINIKHIVEEYDKHGNLDKAIKDCQFEMLK